MAEIPIPRHILSKSTFMYGCQCPKRLWLHKFMPEVKDEEDEAQTAIFQTGTDVGKLAQQLFPGGIDATPVDYFSFQQSVADTAQYIAEGKTVIYEAAFQYDGILSAVDILVRKNKKWYAYEVKSTNSVKDTHIQDAALQYYVMVHSGIDLRDICIVHLNRDYIRYGELNIKQLFTLTTVLNNVLSLQDSIEIKIDELQKVLKLKKMPAIEMGNQCDTPYPCNFQGFCSKDIVQEEPDYGEAYINNEAIEEFISELEYPLYFMDFETCMSAVPECDGHWPYRQVNFQYSVHIQHKPNGKLEHHHYLAEGPHTPQCIFRA